jgi:hypothetical protein
MPLLILVILQVNLSFQYLTILLVISTTISYILGSVLLALLSARFFVWFFKSSNIGKDSDNSKNSNTADLDNTNNIISNKTVPINHNDVLDYNNSNDRIKSTSHYFNHYFNNVFVTKIKVLRKIKNNNNIMILLYGFAIAISTISLIFTVIFYDALLLFSKPYLVTEQTEVIFPHFDHSSAMGALNDIYALFNIVSFTLLWISTTLLLHPVYSVRWGNIRFWTILSMPLGFFLSQFVILSQPDVFAAIDNSISLMTIYTLQGLAGGILFGVPFLLITKQKNIDYDNNKNSTNPRYCTNSDINTDKNNKIAGYPQNKNAYNIRAYVAIVGYGFILSFVSGTATVSQTPYPPFGLASVCFVGVSSYLIFVGLYYSAVVISSDSNLRKSIRKFVCAQDSSKLLESIGTIHMQQEIERRVLRIAKEQQQALAEQSGVHPAYFLSSSPSSTDSIDESEIKQYLGMVIQEIKKDKSGSEDRFLSTV